MEPRVTLCTAGINISARTPRSGLRPAPAVHSPFMNVEDRPGRLAVRCDERARGLRNTRRAIADHCGGRVDPTTIGDLQVVASELLTNAFEHGTAGVITVDVALNAETAAVTVTSSGDARGILHPTLWAFPEHTKSSGRGLALTRAMSTTIEVHTALTTDAGDWVAITAYFGLVPAEPSAKADGT